MSYYADPEALAANPPETWRVVKRGERLWGLHIDTSYDGPAETFRTRNLATAERDNPRSYTRRAVEQERLWYAGTTPNGWKSYAECLAARERNAAWQATRKATREAVTA